MSEGIEINRIIKEFIFILVIGVFGAVIYYIFDRIIANQVYAILFASIIVIILILVVIYRFYEKRERLLSITDVFEKFESAPSTLEIIKNANVSVEFIGISARTFFESEHLEEMMKKKVRADVAFKFLILESKSPFVEIKAKDEGDDPEAWRHDIEASSRRIERIKKGTVPEKIEARSYDELPVWRGIFVNHKIAYITYYPHGHRGKYSPVFVVENKESSLYIPLYIHYLQLWERAGKLIE